MAIPRYDDLFNVTLEALHELGGSASIQELEEEVSKILRLGEEA
jgi:restriction system protein